MGDKVMADLYNVLLQIKEKHKDILFCVKKDGYQLWTTFPESVSLEQGTFVLSCYDRGYPPNLLGNFLVKDQNIVGDSGVTWEEK